MSPAPLQLTWGDTIRELIESVVLGEAREIAVFGTRGDGKTQGVLGAMIAHAQVHAKRGYPLPTRWLGVADKFTSHENKTHWSLRDPMWQGVWNLEKSGHVAKAYVEGKPLVHLELFGVPDLSEMERVRTECHGVWFEEPAPTMTMGDSAGMRVEAWEMAITSQRMPSYHHPAIMSLNYPDEDHWTWTRFYPGKGRIGRHPSDRTRQWVRVPPGERATPAQREEWRNALRDRPDLLRRLLDGEPGTLLLGQQVAHGFREDVHVAVESVLPRPGEPLGFGVDFGLTPAVVIGQPARGLRRILAALPSERAGIKQHLDNAVIPWLADHAPWALNQSGMIYGCYDISGETPEEADIEHNAVRTLEEKLPGLWFPGPIEWDPRRHTLLSAMNHHASPGNVSLQLDPIHARPLVKALSGQWYYPMDKSGQVRKDAPKKPNHPWEDLGDAFIYWLWSLHGEPRSTRPIKVETEFSLDPHPHTLGARPWDF